MKSQHCELLVWNVGTSLFPWGPLGFCAFFFFFFWPHCTVCWILVPWPGIEPSPQLWKHGVLTTGLPANSLCLSEVFKAEIFNEAASPSRRCILKLWEQFFQLSTIIQKTSLASDRQRTGQSYTTKNCHESHNFCPALLSHIPLDIHVGKQVNL